MEEILPLERAARPLRYLFLDLNSYFASVEQQEQSELRGKPVAVVPVDADTTFVIAASYPAKAFGVRCGTIVREAKAMCPGIQIIQARPPLYVSYHKRILEALETVLPIDEVCSIDEMRFRLIGDEKKPENARKIAKKMKAVLAKEIGPCLTSSIGIAPNGFLAKTATEMEKPNGLVTLTADQLPHRLFDLSLTDFTGVNRKMAARLGAAGIFTAQDLCSADRNRLHQAFGSIVGERWWYLLRGFDLSSPKTKQKTLGHSNVLSPSLRTDTGCQDILLRLIQKATARLRAENIRAGAMLIHVKGMSRSWETRVKFQTPTQDSVIVTREFKQAWESRNYARPLMVGVTFVDLHQSGQFTASLFDEENDRSGLNQAVDRMNQKFGKNSIYLAAVDHVKDRASEKIAFGKTWLFSEGKDDNVWMSGSVAG